VNVTAPFDQTKATPSCLTRSVLISELDQIKTDWLEQPNPEYDGRVPAIIIDNERKRLPQAVSPAELIIDDDCEICRASALHAEMGFGPGFWHLDGCNMDEGFAFSNFRTVAEWEAELQQQDEFARSLTASAEEKDHLNRSAFMENKFEL
jgi:hypothetical protein